MQFSIITVLALAAAAVALPHGRSRHLTRKALLMQRANTHAEPFARPVHRRSQVKVSEAAMTDSQGNVVKFNRRTSTYLAARDAGK